MSSRCLLACAVALAVMGSECALAQDGFRLAPAATGMALTLPWHGMALTARQQPLDTPRPAPSPILDAVHAMNLPPAYRRVQLSRGAEPLPGGKLPNQRTGPKREHVVHDICIGC